jgi:methionyl-tRNA synthetase
LPDTAEKILASLNTEKTDFDSINTFGNFETGIQVTDKPEILFKRIAWKDIEAVLEEEKKEKEKAAKIAEEKKKEEAKKAAEITIEDFAKIDLRVGKVLSCERHPDADKLFILKVDVGEEQPRQIVSGLAQSYTPGQVIGKKIVLIANLKEAVIRGVKSQGMLLAGKDGNQIAVVEVNGLEPGTKIS